MRKRRILLVMAALLAVFALGLGVGRWTAPGATAQPVPSAAAAQYPAATAPDPTAPSSAPLPSPSPSAGASSSGKAVRIVAAADIACSPGRRPTADECRQQATSDLALGLDPDAVLVPGDLQYEGGSADDFAEAYAPTWGRLRAITWPAPGNHEYKTDGAAGYFDYFGAAAGPRGKGWYSRDLGTWHIVSLNSNCDEAGGCDPESPQGRWLRADLTAHRNRCVLALWHHPRWSHGKHGDHDSVAPFLEALHEAGAEVVLTGHDHNYQRFEPRRPDGARDDARGIRQFVVGSGGRSHYTINGTEGLEAGDDDTFGVFSMTLRPDGYDWRFVGEPGGRVGDSGSATCH